MLDKEQDPTLQAPQEANTTKHVNFLEAEDNEGAGSRDTNSNERDDSPTKKAWEELRRDEAKEGSSKD